MANIPKQQQIENKVSVNLYDLIGIFIYHRQIKVEQEQFFVHEQEPLIIFSGFSFTIQMSGMQFKRQQQQQKQM